jgi:hypothetical protein
MASVRHLGLFPFCIWPSKEKFIEELYANGPTVYEDFTNETETIIADLETVMAMYWRVKKWKVYGQWDYYVTSKVSNNYEYIFTRDAETEADLVCLDEFGYLKQFTRTGTPITFSWSGGIGTLDVGLSIFRNTGNGPQTNRPIIKLGGNSYAAGIMFVCTLEEGAPDADQYYFSSLIRPFNKTAPTPSFPEIEAPNTTVPITLLGETYHLLASKSEPVISLPDDQGTVTLEASMTIDALEYWPYDPQDGGGPIYDSTTGAQLRPFPG